MVWLSEQSSQGSPYVPVTPRGEQCVFGMYSLLRLALKRTQSANKNHQKLLFSPLFHPPAMLPTLEALSRACLGQSCRCYFITSQCAPLTEVEGAVACAGGCNATQPSAILGDPGCVFDKTQQVWAWCVIGLY